MGRKFEEKKVKSVWTMEIVGFKTFAKGGTNLPDTAKILSYSHSIGADYQTKDKKTLGEISIVKQFDAVTPYFCKAALESKVFSKVILNLKNGNILITYELSDAVITLVRPGGSADSYSDSVPLEEDCFSFKKTRLLFHYSPPFTI